MCCFLPFLRSSWLLVLVVTWFGTFVACLFPVSLVSMRGPVFLVERRLWVFLLFCASPPCRVTKRRGDDGPKFSYEETMSWGMDVHGHIVTSHCNMKSLPAFVRRPLLGMGLAVGQSMLSTVWYVLYCWCDTGAGWGLARHLLVAVGALQSHTVS